MKQKEDTSGWLVAGGLMMGLGVGFVYLKVSVLYFIASLLVGLGIGLLVGGILGGRR